MQEKESYITSLVELLEKNPYYARHFDHRGEKAVMFLDFSNILCQAHVLSVWIDLEDLVYIFSKLYNLKGYYAFTSCNLTKGMVDFLYDTGFVVYQSPFDSDAIMGYTICSVARESDLDMVLIGTHDGGFRGVRDQLTQTGTNVAFVGFREMFSHYLKSDCLYCFEDMNILSPLKRNESNSTHTNDAEIKSRATTD
jgi:hypothetical protein